MRMDDSDPSIARGKILFEQGRFADAERYLTEGLAKHPEDASGMFYLAFAQYRQEAGSRKALETVKRAIALDPNDPDLHALKSFVLVSLDRRKEALEASSEAVRLAPDSSFAFMALAGAHIALTDWAKAEIACRSALEIDPDNTGAANMLAQVLRLQNKLSENHDQVAGMLAKNPEDSDTHANAGWSSLQRGDRKEAEEHFMEALRLCAEHRYARQGLLECFKSRSLLYRLYLNYCFFMQRLGERYQIMLIIGLIVGIQVVDAVFVGPYAVIGKTIIAAYTIFVLWVHLASGVGGLLLLTDRFARHALSSDEKKEAIAVGGGFFAGVFLVLAGITFYPPLFYLGLGFAGAAIPFAHTFTNHSRTGRIIFGGSGAFVLLACGTASLHESGLISLPEKMPGVLLSLVLLAIIATTWLCNIRSLKVEP